MPRLTRQQVEAIKADLLHDLATVRAAIHNPEQFDPADADAALAGVETFCAIAVRLIAQANPSKVRDIAMTVEIQARMDGKEVL